MEPHTVETVAPCCGAPWWAGPRVHRCEAYREWAWLSYMCCCIKGGAGTMGSLYEEGFEPPSCGGGWEDG